MGLREWRLRRSMLDPVVGTFEVVSSYFPHPGRVPMQVMLTGFVEAEGVLRTAAETLDNYRYDHSTVSSLPVVVDRSEPSRFLVLWDEVPKADGGKARARAEAERQARGE